MFDLERYDVIAAIFEREDNASITDIRVPEHPDLPAEDRHAIWCDFREWVDCRVVADGEVVGVVAIDRHERKAVAWDIRNGIQTRAYERRQP